MVGAEAGGGEEQAARKQIAELSDEAHEALVALFKRS